MKIYGYVTGISALWLLCGCSASVGGADKGPPSARETKPESGQVEARPDAPVSVEGPLVRGYVEGDFALENGQCAPFTFPFVWFSHGIFGAEALGEDLAIPVSPTVCRHKVVIDASADAWATVAYSIICLGGGESLCDAQARRHCSVDTLLGWADDGNQGFAAQDPVFHFTYGLYPREPASRQALSQRILVEAGTLVTESVSILLEGDLGGRNCPDEDRATISAAYADALSLHERLSAQADAQEVGP